jgi:hypothetical protein
MNTDEHGSKKENSKQTIDGNQFYLYLSVLPRVFVFSYPCESVVSNSVPLT